MTRHVFAIVVALTMLLMVSVSHAAPRGKGGGKEGGKSAGGKSAERKPEGNEARGEAGRGNSAREPEGREASGRGNTAPGGSWSERSHHAGQTGGQSGRSAGTTGEKAAIGDKASGRNQAPQATGAQGAAAAGAASRRNAPQATGKQGAAAGAAAANRNSPQYSGAQGAAAGAAVADRNAPKYSGAEGAAVGSAAVRNSFDNPNLYSRDWYGAHAGVWAPTAWAAGTAWTPTTWGAVAGYCGANTAPVSYNYGTNVTCQDGNVSVNGQLAGTAAEFSQQAADLAQSGAAAEASPTDEWLPLGVFAMVRNEQQHPQLILQLAINKQGVLRGNYTDELTEHTQPIQGAVDPQTQRAAWTVGDNSTSVMEAGLSNLASGEAPALIHKNGKTDHWLLVRLDQPDANKKAAVESPPRK